MEHPVLSIRRSLKKNLFRTAAFLLAEAAATALFLIFRNPAPETLAEKILTSAALCVYALFSLLSAGFIADGIRNIFGKAAVILSDETLWISGFGEEIPLRRITQTKIAAGKTNSLLILFDGKTAEIKDGLCQLPLYTVQQAIQNRIDDLQNNSEGKEKPA